MRPETPYNPLDKIHLGESIANAILQRPIEPLPPTESFLGAGVYAVYYTGNHPLYAEIAKRNRKGKFGWPIYIGKAIPGGARRGLETVNKPVLFNRLVEHAQSISQTPNLAISDFRCRYLVVDDIWIPLGESLLIRQFAPVWNGVLDGFGNHDPGGGRYMQQRSPWDVIHPGRPWAMKCAKNRRNQHDLQSDVEKFIREHPAPPPGP